MSDRPAVSVLMPVAAFRAHLAEAALSVAGQTLADLELIVIDDAGAPDEAGRMAGAGDDPRVRVIRSPGRGICDALNAGVAAARGRLLCRCDADDLYPFDRLGRHAAWLERHPEFGAVCGRVQAMTAGGRPIGKLGDGEEEEEVTAELRRGVTRVSLCTYTVRADAWRQAGPFRRYFVTAEDIDFQLRLGERCRVWFDPPVAYRYRLHEKSITHTQAAAARVFFEATAREFQSQRAANGEDDLDRGTPPPPPAADACPPTRAADVAQGILIGASWKAHRGGRKAEALVVGLRACLARATNLGAWKSLGALLLKPAGHVPPACPRR